MDDNGKHLTAGLRRGKEEAFAYVFRMYYSPLLNYAGRILKDVEAANDVVQECFCRLYERRRELRKELQVRPYLYKSVYNYAGIIRFLFFESRGDSRGGASFAG